MISLEIEQPLVFQTINNMIEKKRLPHALIFHGDNGTSKYEMATYLVKKMYESYYPLDIDKEKIKKRIDDESFSNLFVISPSNGVIKKDVIQEIISESSKTSFEKGPKFFIFKNAEGLNISSSNSLLKFIEEPLDDIYIIFLVNNLDSMLKTIKSRCAILSFKPLNKTFLRDRLSLLGIEDNFSSILLELSEDELEIKRLSENEETKQIIDFVQELFNEPFEKRGSLVLYFYENSSLIDSEEKSILFLSLITIYLNDIMKHLSMNKAEFIFNESKNRILELASMTNRIKLSKIIEDSIKIKDRIKYHINLRLNLDNFLLDMENAFNLEV